MAQCRKCQQILCWRVDQGKLCFTAFCHGWVYEADKSVFGDNYFTVKALPADMTNVVPIKKEKG